MAIAHLSAEVSAEGRHGGDVPEHRVEPQGGADESVCDPLRRVGTAREVGRIELRQGRVGGGKDGQFPLLLEQRRQASGKPCRPRSQGTSNSRKSQLSHQSGTMRRARGCFAQAAGIFPCAKAPPATLLPFR